MKKYMMVTTETLSNLGSCFANSEEILTFITHMNEMVQELSFNTQVLSRVSEKDSALVVLKQVCILTLFCREHMDLIHQLTSNLKCTELSEEEFKEYKNED